MERLLIEVCHAYGVNNCYRLRLCADMVKIVESLGLVARVRPLYLSAFKAKAPLTLPFALSVVSPMDVKYINGIVSHKKCSSGFCIDCKECFGYEKQDLRSIKIKPWKPFTGNPLNVIDLVISGDYFMSDLDAFTNIETLYIESAIIDEYSFCCNKKLRSLTIKQFSKDYFSLKNLTGLEHLTILDGANDVIKKFDQSEWGLMTKLKSLKFKETIYTHNFPALPKANIAAQMVSLQHCHFGRNAIKKNVDIFKYAPALWSLTLKDILPNIIEVVGKNPQITRVKFISDDFNTIAHNIKQLKSVKDLNISGSLLGFSTQYLMNLSGLESLTISTRGNLIMLDEHFINMSKLKHLYIYAGVNIGLLTGKFLTIMPEIETLFMYNMRQIDFSYLAYAQKLKVLDLSCVNYLKYSDNVKFTPLPNLKRLRLVNCTITDITDEMFKEMPKLKSLDVSRIQQLKTKLTKKILNYLPDLEDVAPKYLMK
jgi:Leucine-rich repeat (LRR) protein